MAESPLQSGSLRRVKCYHCGASNFIPRELAPGTTMPCAKCGREVLVPFLLRHFEVRQAIASGGMGTVYRAYDTVLQREVAVKLMKPELAQDRQKLEEFYREAKVIAALNHPHIIQVFHFGETDGQNFIAMELADAGSLEDRIKAKGRLTEVEVLDVGIKIGDALKYAAAKELLHRDLKPANILFNAAGEPKLVDWGLATRSEDATDWGSGEIWGTPEYVAPEKVRREPETFLSDMYSLGATLYQALTGKVPFECATVQETVNAQVHTPVRPPKELVPEISDATNEAIVRTLAKQPRERFASYDEMIMAFTGARSQVLVGQLVAQNPSPGTAPKRGLTGRLGAATAGSTTPEAAGGRGKTGLLVAVAALVLAAAAAAAWFFLQKKEQVVELPPAPATNAVVAAPPPPPPPTNPADSLPKIDLVDRPKITTPFLDLTGPGGSNYWRSFGQRSTAFPASTWRLQSGLLSVTGTNRAMIVVKERYIDFELLFEWRATEETRASFIFALNEGISNAQGNALRIPLNGNDQGVKGGARNATGALAGLLAANTNKTLKPLGQFNAMRIVAFNNKVEVHLNGKLINSFDLNSARFKAAITNNAQLADRPYFGTTTSGYLGFQPSPGFTARAIRLRAIAEMPKAPATAVQPAIPQPAPAPAPAPTQPKKKK
jgi:serine/threonine protein kinase